MRQSVEEVILKWISIPLPAHVVSCNVFEIVGMVLVSDGKSVEINKLERFCLLKGCNQFGDFFSSSNIRGVSLFYVKQWLIQATAVFLEITYYQGAALANESRTCA